MNKGEWATPDIMRATLLILFAIIIIFGIVFLVNQKAGDALSYKECRISVEKYFAVAMLTGNYDTAHISCKPHIYTIPSKNPDEIKRILAEEMVGCWATFKQGREEMFTQPGIYCHPCAIITLNKNAKPITDFEDYLVSTTMARQDKSYADFLLPFETANADAYYSTPEQTPTTIDPTKKYAVLFVHAKGSDWINTLKSDIGGHLVFSAGVGTVSGVTTFFLVSNPVGWKTALLAAAGIGLLAAADSLGWGETDWISTISLREYNPDAIGSLCQFNAVQMELFGEV